MTTALLLDTHILLWARVGPERLTAGERQAIDSAQIRYVSSVAIWEFGILMNRGRIEADVRLLDIPNGYVFLPILPAHCKIIASLPRLHGDPFDRMLIAQAQSEGVALLTRDRAMQAYHDHATILRYPDV